MPPPIPICSSSIYSTLGWHSIAIQRVKTLTERWHRKDFVGLTNDEQVAVASYGRSYVSVLEVQDVSSDGAMWVVDLFRARPPPPKVYHDHHQSSTEQTKYDQDGTSTGTWRM